MKKQLVSIVLDDPALFDTFLKEYPGEIYERQIHIDDTGERDEERQYWISELDKAVLIAFLKEYGSGNYVIYHAKCDGKVSNKPLQVHQGLSRLELS